MFEEYLWKTRNNNLNTLLKRMEFLGWDTKTILEKGKLYDIRESGAKNSSRNWTLVVQNPTIFLTDEKWNKLYYDFKESLHIELLVWSFDKGDHPYEFPPARRV